MPCSCRRFKVAATFLEHLGFCQSGAEDNVNKAVYADQGETKAGVDDRRFYITLTVTVTQRGIRHSVGLDKLCRYPQYIGQIGNVDIQD